LQILNINKLACPFKFDFRELYLRTWQMQIGSIVRSYVILCLRDYKHGVTMNISSFISSGELGRSYFFLNSFINTRPAQFSKSCPCYHSWKMFYGFASELQYLLNWHFLLCFTFESPLSNCQINFISIMISLC
jgi:hypothetical protein